MDNTQMYWRFEKLDGIPLGRLRTVQLRALVENGLTKRMMLLYGTMTVQPQMRWI